MNPLPRPTKAFLKMLPVYLEWAKCSTPYSGTAWGHSPVLAKVSDETAVEPTAAQVLFAFESHGTNVPGCTQPQLLSAYRTGKANRDFWTKEIGWWRKQAAFHDEEFLCFLTPGSFDELFGHWPRPCLVRLLHDNQYTDTDFLEDCRLLEKGLERVQGGMEIRF